MQVIRYFIGNAEVELPYTAENMEIAKAESTTGGYAIADDGQPEAAAPTTLEASVGTLETNAADMAEALDMILNGVVE